MSATLRWLRRWGISFASLTGGIFTLFVFRRGLPHVAWIIGYLLILWLLFALITQVRNHANPALRDIPAAALTAYARSEDRATALRKGFQLHLAKPIDPAELMASVAALAKRRA